MFIRNLLAAISLSLLAACAPPLDQGNMRPLTSIVQQIPTNPVLEKSVSLGQVSVAEEYSKSSGIGTIDDAMLRSVLTDGLLLLNYLPRQDDEPKYTLNANLVNFDMPSMGFSMDSSCTIKYELVRNSDGKQVFQEAIKQGYHAPFAEALIGAERARLASSKAVRENVTHTLRVLSNLDAATLKGK